jgi:hypothetical protein
MTTTLKPELVATLAFSTGHIVIHGKNCKHVTALNQWGLPKLEQVGHYAGEGTFAEWIEDIKGIVDGPEGDFDWKIKYAPCSKEA